jgi:glycosyltransferase involved in cell wall biosynthesis
MNSLSTATVIIPCLDEEAVIGKHVEDVRSALAENGQPVQFLEVIVVDNGSTDATAAVASAAGARVVSESRRGYGRACLTGTLAAENADLLVFMDGDRSDDPGEIPIVIGPLIAGTADLVIGSRLQGSCEPGSMTTPQRFGNWIACRGLSLLYGVTLSDFGPFRAIRRDDLLALGMQEMTYGWPLEMIARAGKSNMRIVNVPVTWRRRAGGESKVSGNVRASVTTGYRYLRTLVRCR